MNINFSYFIILLAFSKLCHCARCKTFIRQETAVTSLTERSYHLVTKVTECARNCVAASNCTGMVFCHAASQCSLFEDDVVSPVDVTDPTCVVYVDTSAQIDSGSPAESAITAQPTTSEEITTAGPTTTTMTCQNGGTPGFPCVCPSGTSGSYCETRILDCKDVASHVSTTPGTYSIWPTYSHASFDIDCSDFTDYGIQMMFRHPNIAGCTTVPVTYLDAPWASYKKGFTNNNCYMWLGLEKIYAITASRPYELVMKIVNGYSELTSASYDSFSIGDEASEYRLSASDFSAQGNIGDKFYIGNPSQTVNGGNFCTKDRCMPPGQDCGSWAMGGWWYKLDRCASNPHNQYGIEWMSERNELATMKDIEMWLLPK